MTELLPLIGTGLQTVNLAVLVLVLYRVTQLERDIGTIEGRLNETREDVIGLKAVQQ